MSEMSKHPYDVGECIHVKTEDDLSFNHDTIYHSNNPFYLRFSSNSQSFSSCMYNMGLTNCSQPITFKENNGPACRRRLDFSGGNFFEEAKVGPMAVAKRNERERNRVKLINMTFHTLRQHLPHLSGACKGKSRKLSKVQTLRSAIAYIRQLQELVRARQSTQLSSPENGGDQSNKLLSAAMKDENSAEFGMDKSVTRVKASCVYDDLGKLSAHEDVAAMSGSDLSPMFTGISFDLLMRSDHDVMISTDDDVMMSSTDEEDFSDWL